MQALEGSDSSLKAYLSGSIFGDRVETVVSTLVLEHLDFESYRTAVKKCLHLLRSGGWLIAVEGYAEGGSDMVGWFCELMDERRAKSSGSTSASPSWRGEGPDQSASGPLQMKQISMLLGLLFGFELKHPFITTDEYGLFHER